MKSDLEIARRAEMKDIREIAEAAGIQAEELELYGNYKAKVTLEILERLKDKPNGKYIDVTAITPTPLGEGKTVTTIGVSQALGKIGKNVFTCLRQPSLGPVFGIKGGAAGGGLSQVVPMEDFNLHLTGDMHAVSIAHNLLAAFLDAHILHGNKADIDPLTIGWRRVVDVNDRALRQIVVGLGGKANGYTRETGFDISAASEVMAILALSTDIFDMRKRLGSIVVGFSRDGKPVTAEDLKCAGSMAVLLKDALKPTLMQTLEKTPVFVHAGPFANIAHGNNSIVADKIALKLADYVVTESGFGADCGCEKFMNIKCRVSGLKPDAVILTCTVRALKMHGGAGKVVAGKPLPKELVEENLEALDKGLENLRRHIENVKRFGVPVVVAVNKFTTDSDDEIELIKKRAKAFGAMQAVMMDVWAKGGEGGTEVAEAVVKACEEKSNFKFLYEDDAPIKEKIETVARKIYGAKNIWYYPVAERKIKQYTELGWDKLPVCMAKTHLSLSHEPSWKGAPVDFDLPVRDVRASIGAGFLYPILGEMMTMPGLGSVPAGSKIDIDEKGEVVGLF